MEDFKPPRPLEPNESLEKAVYCAECAHLQQDIIGKTVGTCFGISLKDTTVPMDCPYFKNDLKVISILIFLKSGISVYHKAIVEDVSSQVDPELLSSFLRAISAFGEELTNEEVSLIKFQQMNIILCKGEYSNGAMIIRGKISENYKESLMFFLKNVENNFHDYFEGEYTGRCLPEDEIDQICQESLREFVKAKLHKIPAHIIENNCNLKCGINTAQKRKE
jgi:hypothetical protein